SWGGYLGSAYLSKIENQNQVKAWISIVGTNSFSKIANVGKEKLLFYANQQIALSQNIEDWTEIRDWALQQDTITTTEDFGKGNSFAAKAERLMEDSLIITTEMASVSDQLSFVYNSPFNANAWLSNLKGIRKSGLIDHLLEQDIQVNSIQIPSFFIGGKFDFIVPEEVLQDQFDAIPTEEKEIYILPNSGHNIIAHETDELNHLLINFIEKYK
ncbi:MAG: hypothetical protein AAF705_16430, partial [Bacteroidota bacterium]